MKILNLGDIVFFGSEMQKAAAEISECMTPGKMMTVDELIKFLAFDKSIYVDGDKVVPFSCWKDIVFVTAAEHINLIEGIDLNTEALVPMPIEDVMSLNARPSGYFVINGQYMVKK